MCQKDMPSVLEILICQRSVKKSCVEMYYKGDSLQYSCEKGNCTAGLGFSLQSNRVGENKGLYEGLLGREYWTTLELR